MEALEKDDIQGLVLKGYGSLAYSRYAILRVEEPVAAKAWLATAALEVTNGNDSPRQTALNIAFGYHGLQALGLSDTNLRRFAREFREGLTNLHRQRLLGDEGEDAPAYWRWGGTSGPASAENIHILLMAFADSREQLTDYWNKLEQTVVAHGLSVVGVLDGELSKDGRNALNFNDGIAQPEIAGNHPGTNPHNTVAAGEFLLGYRNEYGVYPESPLLMAPSQQGDATLLPADVSSGSKDLGRNGSYLVFRQTQLHPDTFWDFVRANASSEDDAVKLAAKMVGRWPSGAPLVLFPDADPGGEHSEDDFGYAQVDREGLRCPMGSHVRRSNPRDVFEDNSPDRSLRLTNKHRIIRRGRNYRLKVAAAAAANPAGEEEVGLHFLCFNANIARQFEFIQHTWSNFPRFGQLRNDPDPITGAAQNPPDGLAQNFTIPQCPVHRRVHGLLRVFTIRGGAYFFFPSIRAIKYLATI